MSKGLTAAKAKKILEDGTIRGKALTEKQKKFFGAVAGGATPLKKLNGGWLDKFQDGGDVSFDSVQRAIRNVESLDGKLMWNPESTATGLYGQLFSQVKNDYPGTRKEFAADTLAQKKFFKNRFFEGLPSTQTTSLVKDANDIYNEYASQIPDFNYSKEDLAVLSNFLGRQGTREYLGYHVRDKKPLEQALPNIYGSDAKQRNKTPEQYLEQARKYYKEGGWLDKFDNGGVQPNYNDSNVSLPPGFKGYGYDKGGRAYNGAWDGPVTKMGGTIPGATGMMYARTSGTSPEEPKKAQDGTVYDTVMYGTPEYAAAYREGRFADVPNVLDEVVIRSGVDYEEYPLYDKLSPQQKEYFNDPGPIGTGVRRFAQTDRGLAEEVYDVVNPIMYGTLGLAGGMMAGPGITTLARAAAPYVSRYALNPIQKALSYKPFGGPVSVGNVVDVGSAAYAAYATPEAYDKFKENPNFDTGTDLALTAIDLVPFGEIFTGFKGTRNLYNKGKNLLTNDLKPNSDMYYRGIGQAGLDDALQSGLLRAKPADQIAPAMFGPFDLAKRFNQLYVTPRLGVAQRYGKGVVAEVPRDVASFSRRYQGSDWSMMTNNQIPIEQVNFYKKNFFGNYKPIDIPSSSLSDMPWIQPNIYPTSSPLPQNMEPYLSKRVYPFNKEQEIFESFLPTEAQLKNIDLKSIRYDADGNIIPNMEYGGEIDEAQWGRILKAAKNLYNSSKASKAIKNFKSEIDWAKWNKEIPDNKALMQEYNAIEQQAKANGTWMKNPDGSKFTGTPEQFVQQNSKNFKKAFSNTKVRDPKGNIQITNHSTWNKFDEFDLSKFGQTDDGFYGKGVYFHPNTNSQGLYGDINMNSYVNIENPMPHETSSFFGREGKGGYWDSLKNEQVIIDDLSSLWKGKYDGYITNHANYPLNDFNSTEYITNIPSNIKSATGNNGMFDMTNPNIYKTLIPGAVGLGAASQIGPVQEDEQFKNGGEIEEAQWGALLKLAKKYGSKALSIIDRVVPKPPTPGQFFGVEDSWNYYSPLNFIPGYGKKLIDKTSSYPNNFVGFRKFGNSLEDVKESQSLRPKGGNRIGAEQIKSEGNWAEPGKVNENYGGVFEATMKPNVPNSNIKLEKWYKRNGIVGTTKEGNVAIPISDPGLSFNRRLPFSSRYVPINKQKLIDNKFQLATQLPYTQSLLEKYGLWAGTALGIDYLTDNQYDAFNTLNEYTLDPIMNWTKDQYDDSKKTIEEMKKSDQPLRLLFKLQEGGIIEDDRGQWAYPGEITKINSNNITMKGVNYPVLGISDTGDTKMMQPGKDYKFKGNSVTEFPMAKDGKSLVELNQLTNFTNYNTPQPGGWLDKYH